MYAFLKKKKKTFLFYIGVLPISHVVIVSGGQQRGPAVHIYVPILPQTPLPSLLPHSFEKSSLCYTVGLCWLSILNIAVCIALLLKKSFPL